jgi:malonyl-CoA O-methyltransferase
MRPWNRIGWTRVDVGPRRRLVQRIMSECLSRIRLHGACDEATFAQQIEDLPTLLREWATQLETPPSDVEPRPEPPAFQGYALWAGSYDQSEGNPVIAGEEEVIWEMIGDVRGLRVLDVGCGTGRHALPLAATLDASHGPFDLVLCCLVLSHVADLNGAIQKLATHVRPGGRLIVSDFHPTNILLGWRTSCSKDGHKYVVPNCLHLPSAYFNAISATGLQVTRFFEKGHTARLPGLPMTLIMEARRPEVCCEAARSK